MIIASFSDGHSWMHGIDPRRRVIGAVAFAAVVAVCYDFSTLLTALVLSLFMALSARLDWRAVGRSLLAPAIFLLLLWAVLPWSYEGEALTAMGPLTITRPGVILCAQISVKTLSLMVAFMALLATMTVDTLGHSLNRLRLPDKMVHMLLITYRYLFVIEQEYQRLVRAMKIRNFHPGPTCTATGPMPTWWGCCLCGPRSGPGGCTAPWSAGGSMVALSAFASFHTILRTMFFLSAPSFRWHCWSSWSG